MFKRPLAALAAAAVTAGAIALTTPVHAAQPTEDSVAGRYAALDLSTAAGSARFERRVRDAARSLCGTAQLQPINMARQVSACHRTAVANAKADAQVAMKDGGPVRLALRID